MKTAEEILAKYVETPFRHTKIVDADNALKAMEEYAAQFNTLPKPSSRCQHINYREEEGSCWRGKTEYKVCLDCGRDFDNKIIR